MTEREKLSKDLGMTIEFVNWFFDNKKDGCGSVWFMMMAAMWEGWKVSEQKLTDMSVQLANAESKCRELAAELSAVDKIHNEAVFITDDHYEQCPPEVQKMIRSLAVLQIPAYQAFLAEVRAQGVEMFAGEIGDYAKDKGQATAEIIKATGRNALRFAAQLRQEASQ